MVVCSSWRKASRVEQMMRVVGEVWWRRMKCIKSVQRSGANAIGVVEGAMFRCSARSYIVLYSESIEGGQMQRLYMVLS